MADEGEKKESGWLTKVFWGAVKLVTVGVVAAVAWQIFLDPLFFPLFHDTTNLIAQAWVHKVNGAFGWIPQQVGLAKEPGFLTGLMKWLLADEIKKITPSSVETTTSAVDSNIISAAADPTINPLAAYEMLAPVMP